jgi:hypothetical protein
VLGIGDPTLRGLLIVRTRDLLNRLHFKTGFSSQQQLLGQRTVVAGQSIDLVSERPSSGQFAVPLVREM